MSFVLRVWCFRACLVLLLLLGAVPPTVGQDVRFGQPYATGLHLNPALAGTSALRSVTLTSRDQYPALGEGFLTGALSGDLRVPLLRGAVGATVAFDRAGTAPLNRLQASLLYAVHLPLTKQWTASAAVGVGFGQLRGSLSRYTFGDQLLTDGTTGATAETDRYLPASYFTISPGLLVYGKAAWLGAALHQANAPRLGAAAGNVPLPTRLVVHGGYKIFLLSDLDLNRFYEFSLSPLATFQRQGPAQSLDLGFMATYSPVSLGLLLRNPPVVSAATSQRWLVATLGLSLKSWRVGYSYDWGLGQQTRGAAAHELTLRFETLDYSGLLKKRTSKRILPFSPAPAF